MAITVSFQVSSASTISRTTQSVSVLLNGTAYMGGPYTYPNVPVYQGSTQVGTVDITPVDSTHCEFSMAGLQEDTSYNIPADSYEASDGTSSISFPLNITFSTTADETPRIATKSQWRDLASKVDSKQDALVSGTNIKTINNTSLLGGGNISISGAGTITEVQANGTSVATSGIANIPSATTSRYGVTKLSDYATDVNAEVSTVVAATSMSVYKAYQNGAFYGTCDTAAATAAKEVTCANFSLTAGAHITVRFTAANTAANATLNVNNTGAHAIYLRGNPVRGGAWEAYDVVDFVYDNSSARWRMVGGTADILHGTSAPTNTQGTNGDIYIQYTA